jgi:hypothetical protein
MSNTAIRGQEITMRVSVSGQLQVGTMLRCKTFTATPRTDLIEDDYLGESQTEVDLQHHGFDLNAEFDEDGAQALDYLTETTRREEAHEPPQRVTITVMTRYRDGVTRPRVEVYPDVVWKLSERSFKGRKERVPNTFDGKCKTRKVLTQ